MAESRSTARPDPVIPTGDVRHVAAIREGRQSSECWSRARKAEWHEEYDGPPIHEKKLKEAVNDADTKLSRRSTESPEPDEKTLRIRERKADIRGTSKRAGKGKDATAANREHVSKGSKVEKGSVKKGRK